MAAEGSFAGRSLPDPGFADDDGSAPALLLAALASGDGPAIVRALLGARVLVPVVAVLDGVDVGPDGLAREKSADMAVVTIRATSGRLALPAFTSTAALADWNPDGRPVPVPGVLAARAALDEGADALLLDPASDARFAVEGALLRGLAAGCAPVEPFDDPEVHAAVGDAARKAGLVGSQVVVARGLEVDIVVRLLLAGALPDHEVATAARSLSEALAQDPVIRGRLRRGLDLAVERAPLPGR